MDKETLSNYGWVTICCVVVAVMLALATPFGTFIANGVESTTEGFFHVNQNAIGASGLVTIPDQSFDNDGIIGGGDADGGNGEGVVTPPEIPQPELSEQGFYYNVVYYGVVEDDGSDFGHSYSMDVAYIFRKDGTMLIFNDHTGRGVCYVGTKTFTFNESGFGVNDGANMQVNADGTEIDYADTWGVYFGTLEIRTDFSITGVEFEKEYGHTWETGEKFVFHANNTLTYTDAEGNVSTHNVTWENGFMCTVENFVASSISLSIYNDGVLYENN